MTWLTALKKNGIRDRLQLGGKAVSLARLVDLGYPVPPTLVISADVVSEISSGGLPPGLIEEIAQETRTWGRYCARSSSIHEDSTTQAWAGILKSCVDVGLDEIGASIRECIASLYSPPSLKYAESQSISPGDLRMAVILQKFVDGQVSGVGFSIDPVNHFENAVVLEAAKGTAEKLTAGSIIPDRYVVEKTTGRILHARLGESQEYAITRATVIDVAREITHLEQAFGCAIDVEWTIDNGVFVPLQARPITTARPSGDVGARESQSYRFWWLDHDAFWQSEIGIRSFETDQDVSANQLTDVIYIREDGSTRCLISADDVMRLHEVGVELRSIGYFERFREDTIRCVNRAHDVMRALRDTDPTALTPAQIRPQLEAIDVVFKRCAALYRMCDPYATNAVFTAASNLIPAERLIGLIAQPNEAREREVREWRTLLEQHFDEAAAWKHAKAYPWLVPNLFTRDSILATLREKHRVSQDLGKWRSPDSAKPEELALPDSVRDILYILRGLSDLRLQLKLAWSSFDFYFVDLYEAISRHTRVPVRELHGYYSIPGMIALLANESMPAANAYALAHLYDGRVNVIRAEAAAAFWQGRSLSFDHTDHATASNEIRGTVGSHGTMSGVVRVLNCNDPDKVNQARLAMQDGDVLVSAMIQFHVMDLVQRAGGLITDEGGLLSHAAILAREMAIPCIVGTHRATQILRDGDVVELDTKEGCVRVIQPQSQTPPDLFGTDTNGIGE